MKQGVFILSVSPYEVTNDDTGELIVGKSCFYVSDAENVHPIKLSIKETDDYYDQVKKPGLYDMTFDLKVNSKNQASILPRSFAFKKDTRISVLFA